MSDVAQEMGGSPVVLFTELRDHYADTLLNHLLQPGESSLRSAQSLGRSALGKGLGLREMAAAHHESLRTFLLRALAEGPPADNLPDPRLRRAAQLRALLRSLTPDESTAAVKAAESFFAESISPFETSHRESQDAATALQHQNRKLEQQAGRVARALYDQTMQLIAAVHLSLHRIAGNLPAADQVHLSQIAAFLEQIEEQLAGFSSELRPNILDLVGLDAAIGSLALSSSRTTGLEIEVDTPLTGPLSYSLATALYRIVQEALTNISLYARATQATIRLQRKGEAIECSIRDNGVGFDPDQVFAARGGRGLGLIGIRESVRAVGGTFTVDSSTGGGTELRITVVPKGEE